MCYESKYAVKFTYGHSLTYGYLKALWKWGHFDKAKPTFKMLLASWTFDIFVKRIRSFNAENLGSVEQRAAKLPAIKLWNIASLLNFLQSLKKVRIFQCWKFGVCRSKACKVTCCQSWRSLEKVCNFGLYGRRVCNLIRERPGSKHSQSLMASNFVALWPMDFKFLAYGLPSQSDLIYIGLI